MGPNFTCAAMAASSAELRFESGLHLVRLLRLTGLEVDDGERAVAELFDAVRRRLQLDIAARRGAGERVQNDLGFLLGGDADAGGPSAGRASSCRPCQRVSRAAFRVRPAPAPRRPPAALRRSAHPASAVLSGPLECLHGGVDSGAARQAHRPPRRRDTAAPDRRMRLAIVGIRIADQRRRCWARTSLRPRASTGGFGFGGSADFTLPTRRTAMRPDQRVVAVRGGLRAASAASRPPMPAAASVRTRQSQREATAGLSSTRLAQEQDHFGRVGHLPRSRRREADALIRIRSASSRRILRLRKASARRRLGPRAFVQAG